MLRLTFRYTRDRYESLDYIFKILSATATVPFPRSALARNLKLVTRQRIVITTFTLQHTMVSYSVTLLHISLLLQKSDSDSARSTTRGGTVAKPPGAQIRWVSLNVVYLASELSATHRRRAAGSQVAKPNSSRAAGAGGSSNTMLKLYTDDSPGLRVYVDCLFDSNCEATFFFFFRDPFIVLVLSLSFIGSIFFLHISAKVIRAFTK